MYAMGIGTKRKPLRMKIIAKLPVYFLISGWHISPVYIVMATLPDPTECPCRNRATKTIAKFGANANIKTAHRCIIESIIIEHLRPNFPLCNAPPNEPEIFPSTMMLALKRTKFANF